MRCRFTPFTYTYWERLPWGERATYIAGAIDRPVTLRDAGIDKNLAHRAPNLIIRATVVAIGSPPGLGRSSFHDRSR
jgi:hypothetical protein